MFPAGSKKGQHERFKARSVLSANVNPTAPTSVADGADTGAGSAVRAASLWSLIILFPPKNSECLAVSFHTMSDNGKKTNPNQQESALLSICFCLGKNLKMCFGVSGTQTTSGLQAL